MGRTRSASGVASPRNGARTASASSAGPDQHIMPMIARRPCALGGHERHRRAGHDVRDGRQLLRRRLGCRHEPGDRLGRRGQEQRAADDRRQRVEPEPEPGHDPEVAAAAADRPEQVGLVRLVDDEHVAVGRHELCGEEAVDRQPVLADEVADAAARRDPADADRPRVAETGREAALGGRDRCTPRPSGRCRPRPSATPRRSRGRRGRGRRGRCRRPSSSARRRCGRRCGPPGRGRSRGRRHDSRTSSASATRTMTAGRRSMPPIITSVPRRSRHRRA